MQLHVRTVAIVTVGLLWLGACKSDNPIAPTVNSPVATPTAESQSTSASPTASTEKTTTAKAEAHGGQGGQVIESGPYHLELLTVPEADSTHIDFFLQKGDNHAPIPNAKVTAQVQLPDGNQTLLNLNYDPDGNHYYAVLPGSVVGEYQVAILSDIQGEKVNARYTFKR
ncbi:hypothetical protein [Pantanalinema sp. GBBB05]|uniref:hypothetical protein n=1 Tax=Pantanalinema sp. GBBB05 TaxID=2604139 RepID=UPI001D552D31|nr:hypothetical protein [Pantanalinema sp. GBBB05]